MLIRKLSIVLVVLVAEAVVEPHVPPIIIVAVIVDHQTSRPPLAEANLVIERAHPVAVSDEVDHDHQDQVQAHESPPRMIVEEVIDQEHDHEIANPPRHLHLLLLHLVPPPQVEVRMSLQESLCSDLAILLLHMILANDVFVLISFDEEKAIVKRVPHAHILMNGMGILHPLD